MGDSGMAASSVLGLRVSALNRNSLLGEQRKPVLMHCFSKVVVQADNFKTLRVLLNPYQTRCFSHLGGLFERAFLGPVAWVGSRSFLEACLGQV
jgi:hypothetical protein